LNDSLIVINNAKINEGEYASFARQLPNPPFIYNTRYELRAEKSTRTGIVFWLDSDSLHPGNYIYDSTDLASSPTPMGLLYNGDESDLLFDGDNINVNITSYENGLLSGNFTARLSPIVIVNGDVDYSKRGTTVVAEGKFKNVPCSY